jgi:5-methylcytosine-specific restriction endonuclease McrA
MWGPKSGRSSPLPSNWKFTRANVLRRDKHQCVRIREDTGRRCQEKATDVNHKGDPNDHTYKNLESLCSYHHDLITAQQGGLATRQAKAKRKPKSHPGVIRYDS